MPPSMPAPPGPGGLNTTGINGHPGDGFNISFNPVMTNPRPGMMRPPTGANYQGNFP